MSMRIYRTYTGTSRRTADSERPFSSELLGHESYRRDVAYSSAQPDAKSLSKEHLVVRCSQTGHHHPEHEEETTNNDEMHEVAAVEQRPSNDTTENNQAGLHTPNPGNGGGRLTGK